MIEYSSRVLRAPLVSSYQLRAAFQRRKRRVSSVRITFTDVGTARVDEVAGDSVLFSVTELDGWWPLSEAESIAESYAISVGLPISRVDISCRDDDPLYGDIVHVSTLHDMACEWYEFGMSHARTVEESQVRMQWRRAARLLAARIGREL